MLEADNQCCICEKTIRRKVKGGLPTYFCAECFKQNVEDIMQAVPWVRYLLNREKQRRKRRNRLLRSNYDLRPVQWEEGGGNSA
jgi:hypothetical protein